MREINRSVMTPRPKEPYLSWVHSLDEQSKAFTLAQLRHDCVALLIPEIESPTDLDGFLEEYHAPLFEYLLAEWVEDPDLWPEVRDLATLREWFDFEVSSLVFDVCDWPLEHVEEEESED